MTFYGVCFVINGLLAIYGGFCLCRLIRSRWLAFRRVPATGEWLESIGFERVDAGFRYVIAREGPNGMVRGALEVPRSDVGNADRKMVLAMIAACESQVELMVELGEEQEEEE